MRIGQVTGADGRQSRASFGRTVAVPLAGPRKSKTAWHYHQWRRNMWRLLVLFRRAFGFGIHFSRFRSLFHPLSSSPPTTMEHFLWPRMTPLTDVRSISTSAIISFAHTLKTATSTLFTLRESSILPTSSPNRLVASSFKSMLHGLVWALAEGVCWESSRDFIKCPCGRSSFLLL